MDVEVEEYMNSINLENVCRTCLSEGDEMTSLFSEVVIEDPQIEDSVDTYVFLYEIVANVSALQLLTDEGLPTSICKKCIEYATIAYKFKVNCERTESLLHTYVTSKTTAEDLSNKINQETGETPDDIEIELEGRTHENPTINFVDDQKPQLDKHININEFTNNETQNLPQEDAALRFEVIELKSSLKKEFTDELQEEEEQYQEEQNEEACENHIILDVRDESENILHEDESEYIMQDEETENNDENGLEETNNIESEQMLDASYVALNEDNVRLREKIVMKKKKLVGNDAEEEKDELKDQHLRVIYSTFFNEKGQKIYACPLCKKEYRHSASLTVHIRSHNTEGAYVCEICNKSFKQITGLNHHRRSHSGEQPYQCNLCEKRYKQSASLTAHMRVHTGQRPFLCSICGKGFRQAPDLGYHMRTHTNEKPYMCNVCGKRMSMQCHLVQHMRTHTGEKPYPCSKCGKCFASTTRLKRHEIIHTDLKPFACKQCGKAFNRASTLRVHSMLHSEERPHICHLCGKGFIQAHCLRAHLNSHKS